MQNASELPYCIAQLTQYTASDDGPTRLIRDGYSNFWNTQGITCPKEKFISNCCQLVVNLYLRAYGYILILNYFILYCITMTFLTFHIWFLYVLVLLLMSIILWQWITLVNYMSSKVMLFFTSFKCIALDFHWLFWFQIYLVCNIFILYDIHITAFCWCIILKYRAPLLFFFLHSTRDHGDCFWYQCCDPTIKRQRRIRPRIVQNSYKPAKCWQDT